MDEIDLDKLIEELLTVQARIICLEMLYVKFVHVVGHDEIPPIVQEKIGNQLRDQRRVLADSIRNYLGGLR